MQLVLRSEDPVALTAAARQAERELRTLHGIGNVSSSASLVRPEIIVRPDFARAADLGVTAASIGETVRVATAGDYDQVLAKMNVSERQVPIRVKLPDAVRADLDAIGRLTVPGKNGPVLLANVATITMESGPAQIDRLNRSRNVTLEVELNGRSLGEVNAEARALPALRNLPASVQIAELGDAQEMQALFASFGIAMLIGVLCIYGVLVLLFTDFLQPVTILAALPLSIGGAFVALLLTHDALSMPTMIGLIMLMGIVTKNSILLVDYAILARKAGMNRFDALVDACHKRSPPDRHDHDRDGRRHAAAGPGPVRRPELPLADGGGGDRRPDYLDLAEPAGGAGGVHLCGRCRALVWADGRGSCGGIRIMRCRARKVLSNKLAGRRRPRYT
jgi:multidrug efflux pump subunit AcrB